MKTRKAMRVVSILGVMLGLLIGSAAAQTGLRLWPAALVWRQEPSRGPVLGRNPDG